jgi:hypothetical protein
MTLGEFVDKYKGKAVDFDGQFGAQCVDLARQYMKEVWGFDKQPEGVIGVQDFYFSHDHRSIQRDLCDCTAYYDANTPPPSGSLVIFRKTENNKYGHIAVCVEADKDKINVLEQDGIANEKALREGKPQKGAYLNTWDYSRLVGWLTKKETK